MTGFDLFPDLVRGGHEAVVLASDPAAGYRGILAVHSTALGPAVGGTRVWHYPHDSAALTDALRLSRGMTLKNAMAGLPLGGGKSVILTDGNPFDREAVFRAHGRAVERLGGRYITAEDVGSTVADMELIGLETRHVAGRGTNLGDPSPHTSRGTFRALQAAARVRWGTEDLQGRTVALQGVGNVGAHLAGLLHEAGARLVISDITRDRVERVAQATGAHTVPPEAIYAVEADIFAPCGLGAILNDDTIPQLTVEIIVGAANNQLQREEHGEALRRRGILYVPDYVANAGGVLSGSCDILGWSKEHALERIEAIFDTTLEVLETATREGLAPEVVADRMAWSRVRAGR